MKEIRKQKIDRQRGHAADRAFGPIRAALDFGELVITPAIDSDWRRFCVNHDGYSGPTVSCPTCAVRSATGEKEKTR